MTSLLMLLANSRGKNEKWTSRLEMSHSNLLNDAYSLSDLLVRC